MAKAPGKLAEERAAKFRKMGAVGLQQDGTDAGAAR